jgi:predicted Zn-dependent protease with MMP-like domain
MYVSRRRFEELVADALDSIPDGLAEQMSNVAIVVEDWPRPDQVDDRHGLLGLYEGVPLTSRSFLGPGAVPDRITIFRGPLCERARDEADLADHVRTTVVHAVGHHFGINDGRLRELGWY